MGYTALHCASSTGRGDIAKLLIEKGAITTTSAMVN